MRVFVTGASGWIGLAVTRELLSAGHTVVGLARSEASAARVAELGAAAFPGDIEDLGGLAAKAAASDGVIHLAFQHELMRTGEMAAAADADRRAVEAIGAALRGSDRPLVIASGVLGLTPGRVATEDDGLVPSAAARASGPARRQATALFALSLAGVGVRSSVLRFSPTVHGEDDHGFTAALVAIAREAGVSGYVGDGSNRWPAVHRLDAARLARLALESAPAGSVLHAVGEEGVPLRQVAEAIGDGLGVPAASIDTADAPAHFRFLAGAVASDGRASSAFTRKLLGWEPTGPTLLQDLAQGHYFR